MVSKRTFTLTLALVKSAFEIGFRNSSLGYNSVKFFCAINLCKKVIRQIASIMSATDINQWSLENTW
jgi:hypothetical protein